MTAVKYTPNPHQKPELTKEQEDKLMALCDQDIDYSDIPELDNDFWQKAGQRQYSKTPSGGSITNHS